MPTVQVPVQLTVDDLLAAIKQLSPAELREFAQQFARWQKQNGEQVEAAFIEAAKASLPDADERRLKRLIAKSERGTLTEKEMDQYRILAERAEQIDLKRVEALAELARRRGKPARIVMREIGSTGGGNGA
ncbi:MAG: hypothetical protein L0229_16625 [Blastocatellia bacterium]|nr:hypothetical protein [Blastocatellia bacterium]